MATRRLHPGFQPLSSQSVRDGSVQLQGIVFDMDGTLYITKEKGEPQNYMFTQMRTALGISKQIDILDHMHSLPEPQQTDAFRQIQDIEREAMKAQVPQPGLAPLMEFLDRNSIRKGICTRNFDAPVKHLLEKHLPSHVTQFEPIITRDFKPPKPSPAGILHIARAWGVVDGDRVPERLGKDSFLPLVMVGDSVDDMAAGRDAGALTVLLRSVGKGQSEDLATDERTDVVIDRLDELVGLLEAGLAASKR